MLEQLAHDPSAAFDIGKPCKVAGPLDALCRKWNAESRKAKVGARLSIIVMERRAPLRPTLRLTLHAPDGRRHTRSPRASDPVTIWTAIRDAAADAKLAMPWDFGPEVAAPTADGVAPVITMAARDAQ